MIYLTVANCPVTLTTSNVLYPYIDDVSHKWYRRYGSLHSGVDITAKSVYSICQGVVLFVGQTSDDLKEVTVQYDANRIVRYCHLSDVYVHSGDTVERSELIGYADTFVRFEYATIVQGTSCWTVHINSQTYYKHNPEAYAFGTQVLPDVPIQSITTITPDIQFEDVEFSEDMNSEFSDNRVDEVPNNV